MRDVQQLGQLSSATAVGLWAEDAIQALDRIARLGQRNSDDIDLLQEAAMILDAALEQSEEPLAPPAPAAHAVATTDTALGVAEDLAEDRSPAKTQAMLREVAAVLRDAAEGNFGDDPVKETEPAIDFFSAVGQHQLAVGNSVTGHSRGLALWMTAPPTLNFS